MVDGLGKAIDAAIKNSGRKAVDIANAIGVTEQAVSKWRRGGKISRDNLKALCDELGVDLYQYVGAAGNVPYPPGPPTQPDTVKEDAGSADEETEAVMEAYKKLSRRDRAVIQALIDSLAKPDSQENQS